MRGPYIDAVGPVVDAVPPGRALTYADVAELAGWGSARAVGMVMSQHGRELPWWRVVRSDGTMAAPLVAEAREHWRTEGMALRADGRGVDLARVRWDGPAAGPA